MVRNVKTLTLVEVEEHVKRTNSPFHSLHIYDTFGTMDELVLFTVVLKRLFWR